MLGLGNGISATVLTWIGGLISGLVALFVLVDQATFDGELHAAEVRLAQASDASDRRILEQLLTMQRVMIRQQTQQYLTLRRDIITEQIARLWERYARASEAEQRSLWSEIEALQRQQEAIEDELEQMLKSPTWVKPGDESR